MSSCGEANLIRRDWVSLMVGGISIVRSRLGARIEVERMVSDLIGADSSDSGGASAVTASTSMSSFQSLGRLEFRRSGARKTTGPRPEAEPIDSAKLWICSMYRLALWCVRWVPSFPALMPFKISENQILFTGVFFITLKACSMALLTTSE